jgi:hypothetical protein
MHALQQRVEDTAGLQQSERPTHESRQVVGVGKAAEDVGDDLEFSELIRRILPQSPAGEIFYAAIA